MDKERPTVKLEEQNYIRYAGIRDREEVDEALALIESVLRLVETDSLKEQRQISRLLLDFSLFDDELTDLLDRLLPCQPKTPDAQGANEKQGGQTI